MGNYHEEAFKNEIAKFNKLTSFPNPIENIISPQMFNFFDAVKTLRFAVNPIYTKLAQTTFSTEKALRAIKYEQGKYKQSILVLWNDFEKELRTKNRYFPKSDFLTIFKKLTKEARHTLPKGTLLYRARAISDDDFTKKVKSLLNIVTNDFIDADDNKYINEYEDIWQFIKNMPADIWDDKYIIQCNLQNNEFWGCDAKDSDAPIPNRNAGRANPQGISYLYTSKQINTAISEIQPTIGQIINLAFIKTLEKLNIFDFNFNGAFKNSKLMEKHISEIKDQLGLSSFWELSAFFNTLADLFSKPILGDTEYYYTTQYISELLKDMGFDGIKYKSSLTKRGSNIVLFDTSRDENNNPKKYIILRTSLYKTESVKVSAKRLLPK